jgi:hypothetical protein
MQSKLEAVVSYILFPFENWYGYKGNTPYLLSCSSGRNIPLKEKKLVMLKVRDTCKCWNHSLEVRSLRVFNNVLLIELNVNFQRICCTFSVFQWEKQSLYCKKPVVLKVRDTCVPWNNMIKVRSCSVLHITSLWEMSLTLKRILPISHCFQLAVTFTLRKKAWILIMRDTCECLNKSLEVRSLSQLENVHLWELSLNFKRIFLTCHHFKWENHLLHSKEADTAEWKRYMYLLERSNKGGS